ncbi:Na+/H+ antiporter subunit E [Halorussus caseinilyticus]|uniref:Na+/H+ antiporter subunit E n=1 Tax=Halorussus caseinilyticus TaxID=3034025 RepID=UPI0023E81768|nr:Na+/H+ antiporter subunit E [Halorussus sp. DT72]
MRGSELSSSTESPTARLLATFAVSYGFYLALGNAADPFDLVTGAVSAGVVAVAFAGFAFPESPSVRRTGGRLVRALAALPVLLWEILKANVALAAILLDPRLPIDPSVVRVESAAESDLERTAFASAVTLTPGTVVLDVTDDAYHVHALTAASRESLREGSLSRVVASVFRDREDLERREGDGGRE